MCSSSTVAYLCQAIDDLARQAAGSTPGTPDEHGALSADALLVRLAAVWTLVAEADPELARRLPGYLNVLPG